MNIQEDTMNIIVATKNDPVEIGELSPIESKFVLSSDLFVKKVLIKHYNLDETLINANESEIEKVIEEKHTISENEMELLVTDAWGKASYWEKLKIGMGLIKNVVEINLFKDIENFKIEKRLVKENDDCNSIENNSIAISKSVAELSDLDRHYEYFNGVVADTKQLKMLIDSLPSDDSMIYISGLDSISRIYGKKITEVGVYVENGRQISRLTNYSLDNWANLQNGIRSTFMNLGARKITILDNTAIEMSSSATVKGISSTAKGKRIESFAFSATFEPHIDIDKAKASLVYLNQSEGIKSIAEHIIENGNKVLNLSQVISLDVSFGLNADVLKVFQSEFSGGYNRCLDISIEF